MYNPVSTLRLQFNKDFTFQMLEEALPVIANLGVRTIYASPIFKAVSGSTHGYDVTNPLVINPEIGTEEDLVRICSKLAGYGIGWIQDIVPNHMAFDVSNPWLNDVLEKGPMSAYADFFDTSWADDFFHDKVMVPFLGDTLEHAIDSGELTVEWQDGFFFRYFDHHFPLSSRSYEYILKIADERLPDNVASILNQLDELHQLTAPVHYNLRWIEILNQLTSLSKEVELSAIIQKNLSSLNSNRARLEYLAGEQYYRLCAHSETNTRINYRRFFTINGLICLNIQHQKVFSQYHALIEKLVTKGLFQGLRIDHVDGLFDPEQYIHRLRALVGDDVYIVVEKILEPEEKLREAWPVQGTTGYDFLATVGKLFTWNSSKPIFDQIYSTISTEADSHEDRTTATKRLILTRYMQGELENLTTFLIQLIGSDAKIQRSQLSSAIEEFLVRCLYYRFYSNALPLNDAEKKDVMDLLDECIRARPDLTPAFNELDEVLLERPGAESEEFDKQAGKFYMRLMQFTGPLMAKGVEDTLMYTFNRFVARNEVGDSPDEFSVTVEEFHANMIARQSEWPLSLNATATHDTKRGEDARMRLSVLTDLGHVWRQTVEEWFALSNTVGAEAIDRNDLYFIFQTLISTYPNGLGDDYPERAHSYLLKALREAKVHSKWEDPNERYEEIVTGFVRQLITVNAPFLVTFEPFVRKVSDHGIVNSLGQLTLKATCPGVPDIYQNCLSWDLSFVDPDNRRPVNFHLLKTLQEDTPDIKSLWLQRENGNIKAWLTRQLLQVRSTYRNLFATGRYVPLKVSGKLRKHIVSFAREHQGNWMIVAILTHTARLVDNVNDLSTIDWDDTIIHLPEECSATGQNLLNGALVAHTGQLAASSLFDGLPVFVGLLPAVSSRRSTGILMPLTSLPSSFSIGDMGSPARRFADFLFNSRVKIWQMLPVNDVDRSSMFSPYSAVSSIAGNTMLISIEDLVNQSLVLPSDLPKRRAKSKGAVDYSAAQKEKGRLLDRAWVRFKNTSPSALASQFERFQQEEADWLDSYADFKIISGLHPEMTWDRWPNEIAQRDPTALETLREQHQDELMKVKWLQFIFFRQMKALRFYCYERGIQLMGDVPFYICHHSADVWNERNVFDLEEDGRAKGVAGVPPDYFNKEGQLWGMPVFNWSGAKDVVFHWWIRRLRKSLTLFDSLRLDHFRAFNDYWVVPAGDITAKQGRWEPGPGSGLFDAFKAELGELPFVAEDLGDISSHVYDLRDEFNLPGMKVLQFGFGSDFPTSPHLPHNHGRKYLVYPGTHDNNTTRGWYENEATALERKNLDVYFAQRITAKSVADILVRAALSSHADTAIVAMQDLLSLNASARINKPSTTVGNWTWRLKDLPDETLSSRLRKMVITYQR